MSGSTVTSTGSNLAVVPYAVVRLLVRLRQVRKGRPA
jgi:hypothetical protein